MYYSHTHMFISSITITQCDTCEWILKYLFFCFWWCPGAGGAEQNLFPKIIHPFSKHSTTDTHTHPKFKKIVWICWSLRNLCKKTHSMRVARKKQRRNRWKKRTNIFFGFWLIISQKFFSITKCWGRDRGVLIDTHRVKWRGANLLGKKLN